MKVGDLVYRKDHDEKEWRPIYIILEIDYELSIEEVEALGWDADDRWEQYLVRRIPFNHGDDIIPFFANGLEVIDESR